MKLYGITLDYENLRFNEMFNIFPVDEKYRVDEDED